MDKEMTFWADCCRIEAIDRSYANLAVAIAAIVEALKRADERSSN